MGVRSFSPPLFFFFDWNICREISPSIGTSCTTCCVGGGTIQGQGDDSLATELIISVTHDSVALQYRCREHYQFRTSLSRWDSMFRCVIVGIWRKWKERVNNKNKRDGKVNQKKRETVRSRNRKVKRVMREKPRGKDRGNKFILQHLWVTL